MSVTHNQESNSRLLGIFENTHEFKKFIVSSFIMVLTLYVYSVLRVIKDAIVISEAGAEVISALKLYGVLPSAILFFMIYAKISDIFTRVSLYHILNATFIGFFVVFNFVLAPNAAALHPDLSGFIAAYPALKYLALIISHWTSSLFYIMSELWGSVMLSLMFWQLANQICSVSEAKRFYALFGFVGQIGLISSGALISLFTSPKFASSWSETQSYVTVTLIISGIILSMLLQLLCGIVGTENINAAAQKKKKEKLTLMQSIQFVMQSKHIRYIALLILCYGVSINLVEGLWKKQVEVYYQTKSAMGGFYGQIQIFTGIATVFAMLLGSYSLRFCKWSTVAIVTPIMILVTGIIFFIFVIFSQVYTASNIFPIDTANLIFFAVIIGAAQNVLSKAFKYSFFDPTKEIAYIPLDEQSKVKGKAAADVIGGRMGKSGGAVVQQAILTIVTAASAVGGAAGAVAANTSLVTISPYTFAIFTLVMIVWIYAVSGLSKLLKDKV